MTLNSTPTLSTFDPHAIPYHYEVLKDIRSEFDYSIGTYEVLLSGSLGSGKSTLLAHIAVTHCLFNNGAVFLLGRLSMPALRSTIFNKVLEHIGNDLIEQKDYWVNLTSSTITFRNGSKIISRSWSDKKYFKVRSLELSGVAIEETTENPDDEFYKEIKTRVGRLSHVKENIIVHATNPSDPSHWAYKYFIEPNSNGSVHPTKRVYYSLTEQNKFLPPQYISQLKKDLDPKHALRMLYGVWNSLSEEVIYYAYDSSVQYSKKEWSPDPSTSIILSFDFNIGLGKPMSALAMCFQGGVFHVFAEVVVHGARTDDVMDEFFNRGIIKSDRTYQIDGDASGRNRSTNSKRSDYDIICARLDQEGVKYSYKVRLSNPPIRLRHNIVNAYCMNANKEVRLFVHNCKTVDEGLRLVAFKKGASLVEDDGPNKPYQHISTALGYAICRVHSEINRGEQRTVIL